MQKEYIQLLRSLFKSSLTDKMIAGAYMTGILPIKKYGTQSAMTDFCEYSMLSPGRLAEYVGFTEPEVQSLCRQHHMDFEQMKHWYDGYAFRQIKSVYNPNSVIKAIANGEFDSYWTRTETYESLKVYIDMDFDGLQEALVQMLGGSSYPIKPLAFQNDMTSINNRDDVFTLLVHLGYLAYDADEKKVRIPNEEIRQEFVVAVENGTHKEVAKLIQTSDLLLKATLRMDEEAVATAIEEAHSAGTAPLYYNDEQALAQIKNRKYPQTFEDYGSGILLVGVNYDDKTKQHTCRIEKLG